MGRQFVTGVSDMPNQRRMAFGDPTQNKECGTDVLSLKQIEQPLCVPDNSALEAVPTCTRHAILKRRDMEIVLDVHGHGVDNLGAGRHRTVRCKGSAFRADLTTIIPQARLRLWI
jgi:hypothetical protein